MRLTEANVAKLAQPGRANDDDLRGFFLDISPKGKRAFFVRYEHATKHAASGRHAEVKRRIAFRDASGEWAWCPKLTPPPTVPATIKSIRDAAETELVNGRRRPIAGTITLRSSLNRYIDENKGRLSPQTITMYRDLERTFAPFLDMQLKSINRDMLKARHRALTENGKYAANRALVAFRAVYRAARDNDLSLPELPRFKWLHPERRAKDAIKDLPAWWQQLEELEEHDRCFLALLLLTGARVTTLGEARWEHVDIEARRWHFPKPKGGENRAFDVPLSDQMVGWIERAKEAAAVVNGASPFVFPRPHKKNGHVDRHTKFKISHAGNKLRTTFRTVANRVAPATLRMVLMNHATDGDVHDGYFDADAAWKDLAEAQQRISNALTTLK